MDGSFGMDTRHRDGREFSDGQLTDDRAAHENCCANLVPIHLFQFDNAQRIRHHLHR